MLIDFHAYAGHYPFRKLPFESAQRVFETLGKAGISLSVVSNINAVFYRDAMQGNLELAPLLKGIDPSYYVTACVINPTYPGWREDFLVCVERLGFRVLRLYPAYHAYRLGCPESLELVDLAAKLNVPVQIPCALENIRQRHWMDVAENPGVSDFKTLIQNSEADIVISNGPSEHIALALKDATQKRRGGVYYDFTRLYALNGGIKRLVEAAGADRIVFGSLAPLQYIEPQLVKLNFAPDFVPDGISFVDKLERNANILLRRP
ncbi:MAG: amidohydrolase [Clostridiales bacterium]|jgi:predicted TIM-barrel fold metal-dependent hydrolase|nr:amidohydrolase [Clostridiales bacterium]